MSEVAGVNITSTADPVLFVLLLHLKQKTSVDIYYAKNDRNYVVYTENMIPDWKCVWWRLPRAFAAKEDLFVNGSLRRYYSCLHVENCHDKV